MSFGDTMGAGDPMGCSDATASGDPMNSGAPEHPIGIRRSALCSCAFQTQRRAERVPAWCFRLPTMDPVRGRRACGAPCGSERETPRSGPVHARMSAHPITGAEEGVGVLAWDIVAVTA